jgi:hypothetical protein
MIILVMWVKDSQEVGTSSTITGWNIDKMEEKDLKKGKGNVEGDDGGKNNLVGRVHHTGAG